jgi:pilus assembly protein CpaC
VVIPQGLGTISVKFKQFGTRVDFVPFVVGNGIIKLQVRPEVSEVDEGRAVTIEGTRIPGLRTRSVDTAVEMRAGQTLALAGLIQQRVVAQNRGLPFLADLPVLGIPFRRVQDEQTEVELLVLVRPELVDALDPHEVPPCGPGESTTIPSDKDLYHRGYLEVPACGPEVYGTLPTGAVLPGDPAMAVPAGAVPGTHPQDALPAGEAAGRYPAGSAGAPLSSSRFNSYHSPLPTNVSTGPAAGAMNSSPQIVGGTGYDVLDFKR